MSEEKVIRVPQSVTGIYIYTIQTEDEPQQLASHYHLSITVTYEIKKGGIVIVSKWKEREESITLIGGGRYIIGECVHHTVLIAPHTTLQITMQGGSPIKDWHMSPNLNNYYWNT